MWYVSIETQLDKSFCIYLRSLWNSWKEVIILLDSSVYEKVETDNNEIGF